MMIRRSSGFVLMLMLIGSALSANNALVEPCDRICGKWESDKKNCVVQVFHDGDDFGAKLVWFNDDDDPSKPMETRTDINNPDKELRARKLIGMNVLEGMTYKAGSNSWEDGKIYDAQTGKKWSSSAVIAPDGKLKVTGYWKFKFIGRTMGFHRVQ